LRARRRRSHRAADRPAAAHGSELAHRPCAVARQGEAGGIDVYFIGDSIARRWGATDYPDLLAHWKKNFFGWNAADFGWGADKTENILWRLEHGELDEVHPKIVVILAGTNNVGNRPGGDAKIADITAAVGNRVLGPAKGAGGDDRPDRHLSPQRQHGGRAGDPAPSTPTSPGSPTASGSATSTSATSSPTRTDGCWTA
jgi:hypothetical protein